MKNLNLENLGVQEMTTKEVKKIDGGFVFLACCVASACSMGFIAYCNYANAQD